MPARPATAGVDRRIGVAASSVAGTVGSNRDQMITQPRNPVEWICLLTELDKARSRLDELEMRMMGDGAIEEAQYAAHMRQIYAHLNRAWNSRALTKELSQEEWSALSKEFPADLEPLG